jgi:hypothetical protein
MRHLRLLFVGLFVLAMVAACGSDSTDSADCTGGECAECEQCTEGEVCDQCTECADAGCTDCEVCETCNTCPDAGECPTCSECTDEPDAATGDPVVLIAGDVVVKIDETLTLTATTVNGEDSAYTWMSADEGVATVDDMGVVTGVAEGEAVITATGVDTGATGDWGVAVVVEIMPDAMVTVTGDMSLMVGATLQLAAATADGTDSGYAWTSGDDAIATVDDMGVVTGVAEGEVVITATGADTGAAGTHGVVVMAVPEDGLDIPFEELWGESGHSDEASEAFRHWDEDDPPMVAGSCAKCHSSSGYMDFLGADGSAMGTIDNEHAPEMEGVTCVACHNAATIDKSAVVFPSGVEIKGLGKDARCMECHQGRASTTSVNEAITEAMPVDDDTVTDGLGFKNVHYSAAAATLFGGQAMGGYQYDGMAYDAKFGHIAGDDSCLTCHDPHTLEVKLDTCTACHGDLTAVEDLREVRMVGSAFDYDGDGDTDEGIYHEIETLQETVYGLIQAYATEVIGTGIIYDSHTYPYFFIDTNADGLVSEGEANYGNKYATWSARLVRATYNYQFSLKDHGGYAHNGKYVIQLLVDSAMDLNGALATPQDLSGLHRMDAGHFAGSEEAWRHWDGEDDDFIVGASCARCHTADGLAFYLETGTNVDTPASNGMTCGTCHPDQTDFSVQLTADDVTFPSGAVIDSGSNTSNLCMSCHQGRASTATVDEAVTAAEVGDDETSDSLSFKNVHYFAAGATLFGSEAMGGYQYADKTYDMKFAHIDGTDTCETCHSVHTLELKLTTCAACHDGVTSDEDLHDVRMAGSVKDYDGDGDTTEGMYYELMGLEEILYGRLQAYATEVAGTALIYDSHAYPYFFVDTNANGEVDPGEGIYPNKYASWTPRLLRGAYNFQYAKKDTGAFAHNAKYVIQLLVDSAMDLNDALAAPADLSGLHRMDAGHFAGTDEAWRHWDEDDYVVGGSCAKCHSATGLPAYLADGSEEDVPASNGMTCGTCHPDLTDLSVQHTVADVTFPSGAVIDSGDNTANLCMTCHQGRASTATVDDAITAAAVGDDVESSSLSFKNVHYFAAGATVYGSEVHGAYEYAGKTYAGKFGHTGMYDACNECHGAHALEITAGDCGTCHSAVTDVHDIRMNLTADYDGDGDSTEGIAYEIEGLNAAIYTALQAYCTTQGNPIVYDSHAYPYFFNDTDADGLPGAGEANYGNKYNHFTPTSLRATYNFQYAKKDPGAFAHNPTYVIQVLHDTLDALDVDLSGFTRP